MIQRKQTLYFLGVFVISLLLLWTNPTFFKSSGKISSDKPAGEVEVGFSKTIFHEGEVISEAANTLLSSTILVIGLIAFISIFLFKMRKWQMVFSMVNILFVISVGFIMYFYSFKMNYIVAGTGTTEITLWAFLPLTLLLFNYLAYKGVKKDEMLIRSVDRIR